MSNLDLVRALYPLLSEADQAAIISDFLEGDPALDRSDAFIDAILPLDRALTDAVWAGIDAAIAGPAPDHDSDRADHLYEEHCERQYFGGAM